MKKVIKIMIIVSFTSCTKDWVCTIETTSELGTSYYDVDFRGTNEEKNEFEDSGTQTTNFAGNEIIQETNCIPD